MYREMNAVCSQTRTEQLYALCGQNVEILIIKPDGMYNSYWTLKQLTDTLSISDESNIGIKD